MSLRPAEEHAASSSAPDDVALLGAVARGDEEALAGLYDRHGAAVYGLARRVVRDPDLAAEVTQDVFVALWRQAARVDPHRTPVRQWLLMLAHRRAVDRVRREQTQRDYTERAARRIPAAATDPTAETIVDGLDAERVRRALASLTDLQRQAIELAYYGGRTYREVAALLGVPEGTIKSRLRDGLARLRDLVEGS